VKGHDPAARGWPFRSCFCGSWFAHLRSRSSKQPAGLTRALASARTNNRLKKRSCARTPRASSATMDNKACHPPLGSVSIPAAPFRRPHRPPCHLEKPPHLLSRNAPRLGTPPLELSTTARKNDSTTFRGSGPNRKGSGIEFGRVHRTHAKKPLCPRNRTNNSTSFGEVGAIEPGPRRSTL